MGSDIGEFGQTIDYSACDQTVYQQDVVIHRTTEVPRPANPYAVLGTVLEQDVPVNISSDMKAALNEVKATRATTGVPQDGGDIVTPISETAYVRFPGGGAIEAVWGRLYVRMYPTFDNGAIFTDAPKIEGNTISYADEGITLQYDLYQSLLKETIILESPTAVSFRYDIGLTDWITEEPVYSGNGTQVGTRPHVEPAASSNWSLDSDPWGNLILTINGAETVVMPRPFCHDAEGVRTDLDYVLDREAKTILLTGIPESARYPVTVDPIDRVVNGGFETGDGSGWTSGIHNIHVTKEAAHSGTYGGDLWMTKNPGYDTYGSIYSTDLHPDGLTECSMWIMPVELDLDANPNDIIAFFVRKSEMGLIRVTSHEWTYCVDTGPYTLTSNPYARPRVDICIIDGYNSRRVRAFIDDLTSITYVPPIASFSTSPTSGYVPLTVQFTDSSATGDRSPESWVWDFGDGSSSTEKNPAHTYTVPGVYTVSLTATNFDGSDTETKIDLVTVLAPSAGFSATPLLGHVPQIVQFTDQSAGVIDIWSWDFGDGTTSTEQNPSHTYTAAGNYTVSLTAGNTYYEDTETKVGFIAVYTPGPYYVRTYADLCKVGTGVDGWTLDADYIQTADIQCPAESNFPRIGRNPGGLFTGTYDGRGYEIRNLYMSYSDYHTGMFVIIGGPGIVQNVTLVDVSVTSTSSRTGALVGESYGTISGCTVSGTITGSSYSGGLVGRMGGGSVTNSQSSSTIVSTDQAGGLIGSMCGGAVTQCSASGSVGTSGDSGWSRGGLIGSIYAGEVLHSTSSCTVMGHDQDGGLIGYMSGGTIVDCHASGRVGSEDSFYALGGLVGRMGGGSITDSSSSGDVVGGCGGHFGGGSHFGGLIGNGEAGSLTRCSATGSVSHTGSGSGVLFVGGLVGLSSLTITECYTSGSVSGGYLVGGLVGRMDGGQVLDSYATGPVTATSEPYLLGGLVGSLEAGAIRSCYATGLISAPGASAEALEQRIGGLVGYSPVTGITEDCFWNIETTGQAASRCDEVGKTTAEMKTIATFAAWDIATPAAYTDEVWYIVPGEDYPRLAWQGLPPLPDKLPYPIAVRDAHSFLMRGTAVPIPGAVVTYSGVRSVAGPDGVATIDVGRNLPDDTMLVVSASAEDYEITTKVVQKAHASDGVIIWLWPVSQYVG